MVASNFGRTVGRVNRHSAIQIPHDAASAKYGMHLSKSTYQRSTPRTICFCGIMAPGGQALVQTWQVEQNSSAPKRAGAVGTSGISVVTPARRTPAPNFGLINEPCLPSSPRPDAMAGGNQDTGARRGAGRGMGVVPLRANPVREPVGRTGTLRVLIANVHNADTVGLIRRNFFQTLVVVSEAEHDDPRFVDRVPLEDVERIHGRDAHVVSLVRKCEGFDVVCE